MVAHVLQRRGDLDFLFSVLPDRQLRRHRIELQLISLIVALNRLLDAPAAPPRGHDVMKLWNRVQPKLAAAFPKEPPRDAENADRVLRQLHAVDPTARLSATIAGLTAAWRFLTLIAWISGPGMGR